MIEIVVNPLKERPGKFRAVLQTENGERVLLAGSRTPFLDSARILLGEGVDPKTRIGMRHAGANHIALTSTVGAAAKLAVQEDARSGPRFRLWEPFDRGKVLGASGRPCVKNEPPLVG